MLLYSLKLDAGGSDRYLYHVAAFHSLLLAGGILWLFSDVRRLTSNRSVAGFGLALVLLVLVNPVNTAQSAIGAVPREGDPRHPTGSSGGDYYREVVHFMQQQGVGAESPVVDATGRPYLMSLALGRPFTREWTSALGRTYDLGKEVYAMRISKHETDQSTEAMRLHDEGFLITDKYRLIPPQDFHLRDVHFSYLGSLADPYRPESGFLLHKWKTNGPDTPAFGALFEASAEVLPGLSRAQLFSP
jgi:hypothetical protein